MGRRLVDAQVIQDRGLQGFQPRPFGGQPDPLGVGAVSAQPFGQCGLAAGGVDHADAGMMGQGIIRPGTEQVAFAPCIVGRGFQVTGQGGIGGLIPAD